MMLWTLLRVSLRSLWANPLRTLLSMLGIIIGVGAVIAMLALGAGAQKQVLDQVSAMGTNLLVVRPGQAGLRGVATGDADTLTVPDALALLDEVPGVAQAAPVVSGSAQVKFLNQNSRTMLTGTTATYFSIRNFTVARGRAFSEAEVNQSARVAVLGPSTVETLFGGRDPLGQTVKVNGINFRVIGVLAAKGDQGWFNPDDQVLAPFTTVMKQVLGLLTLREVDLQVAPAADVYAVQAQATQVLRRRHRLTAEQDDDFYIRNQAEFLETASNFGRIFSLLLGGIASISLLVGGIGIMNIMLVSVTERTREIGIRKAIGARRRDILLQFLLEAVLLSGLGGLLGVGLGVLGAAVLPLFAPFPAILQPGAVLLSLGFAMGIGVFFGFYPAYQAARLNPIDALRYE